MKKIILAVIVAATTLIACKENKEGKVQASEAKEVAKIAVSTPINTAASLIHWKGTKPAGAHNGTVLLKSGSVALEDGKLTGGSFVIDLNTIHCLDLPEDGDLYPKLVGHLKAADFFDVATYPTAKFEITEVVEKEGQLLLTGNMTIKDVTKSISIPTSLSQEGGVTVLKATTFKIDRTDFNVKYGSKKLFADLKDKFIDDLIELSFEVKTN